MCFAGIQTRPTGCRYRETGSPGPGPTKKEAQKARHLQEMSDRQKLDVFPTLIDHEAREGFRSVDAHVARGVAKGCAHYLRRNKARGRREQARRAAPPVDGDGKRLRDS